jgi:hypothetical protein
VRPGKNPQRLNHLCRDVSLAMVVNPVVQVRHPLTEALLLPVLAEARRQNQNSGKIVQYEGPQSRLTAAGLSITADGEFGQRRGILLYLEL